MKSFIKGFFKLYVYFVVLVVMVKIFFITYIFCNSYVSKLLKLACSINDPIFLYGIHIFINAIILFIFIAVVNSFTKLELYDSTNDSHKNNNRN